MLTQFILETLKDLGKFSIDFVDAMTSDYGSSYKKLRQMITYSSFYHELFLKPQRLTPSEYQKLERQRFYNLLSHLQKEGLVEKHKNKKGRNSFWVITPKGEKKLKKLKEKQDKVLPKLSYKLEKDNELKIIIFDIPEKERHKRDWLRQNLLALDFKPLQKSVWIGYTKLPEEFFEELKNLNLLSYIEIFTIHKTGTIKKYKTTQQI